jgi:DNA polymerase III alpha subunit
MTTLFKAVIWLLRWTKQRPQTTMGRRGSTRIGESLKTFNDEWGRRVRVAGLVVVHQSPPTA